MKNSAAKILTTHVGSLPFLTLDRGIGAGDESHLADNVKAVVDRQREIGINVINEGEYAKGGDWLRYMQTRFGGFTDVDATGEKPLIERGKDREEFADFYKYATERGTLFYAPGAQMGKKRPVQVCTGPVTYVGGAALQQEIDVTVKVAGTADVFLTSTAPASLEVYRHNRFYKTDEEYVYALSEAMRVEYEAIVAAGLLLQVDDAWLPALWDRIGIGMGLPAFRARCAMRIEALNHALRNISEDRIRYHLCWGSWHGPHAFDLELDHIVDLMLEGEGAGLSDRRRQCAPRARSRGVGESEAAGGQDSRSRRRHPFDRRGGTSRAGVAAPAALCQTGRQGKSDGRHRLRLRRPLASADRLGQAAFAGRRRGAGDQGAGVQIDKTRRTGKATGAKMVDVLKTPEQRFATLPGFAGRLSWPAHRQPYRRSGRFRV